MNELNHLHHISLLIIVNEFAAPVSISVQTKEHNKLLCAKNVLEIMLT